MRERPQAALSRARALAALAALSISGPLLAACERRGGNTVAIGAKNFTEELVLGELYAQVLERHGLRVIRKFELGGTQVAMAALRRGDIDLYPEYTGTALLSVLRETRIPGAAEIYRHVSQVYRERFALRWLAPAPFNDTQALATTQAVAQKYALRTLSDVSRAAPQLRLGAIPEFTTRPDGLPGLQRAYGGFRFAHIALFDIGLKYAALETGRVDVVVAFGTDGQIAYDKLVLFEDDKHFWPAYQAAPVIREDTLARLPAIATWLDGLSPLLTDAVMRRLNAQVDREKQDPADAAGAFLRERGLA